MPTNVDDQGSEKEKREPNNAAALSKTRFETASQWGLMNNCAGCGVAHQPHVFVVLKHLPAGWRISLFNLHFARRERCDA